MRIVLMLRGNEKGKQAFLPVALLLRNLPIQVPHPDLPHAEARS